MLEDGWLMVMEAFYVEGRASNVCDSSLKRQSFSTHGAVLCVQCENLRI